MFLLLLMAMLTGCQQFSGHCPIGNTVLCPFWRKAPGTKKLGTGALSLCLFHRRPPGWGMHVARCGGGVLWHDKVFKISMQSSHEESGGCGVSWGKWLNFCSTALFLDTNAYAVVNNQTKRYWKCKTSLFGVSKFCALIQSFKYCLLLS